MRHIAWIGLALVIVASTAQAEENPIDAIVASNAGEGGTYWSLTAEELAAYPAVARAVAQPDHIINVGDSEQDSTHAFFAAVMDRDVDGIEVDGKAYSVGITLAHALPPSTQSEEAGKDSPGPAALTALAAVAGVGAALRRRR